MNIAFRFVQLVQCLGLACCLVAAVRVVAATPELRDQVKARVDAEYASLEAIYKNLHAHPELSFMEVKTAAFLAGELRTLGFDVTEKVGNTGIVAVLKNGPGVTVLLRGDMDGLPVKKRPVSPTRVRMSSRTWLDATSLPSRVRSRYARDRSHRHRSRAGCVERSLERNAGDRWSAR